MEIMQSKYAGKMNLEIIEEEFVHSNDKQIRDSIADVPQPQPAVKIDTVKVHARNNIAINDNLNITQK